MVLENCCQQKMAGGCFTTEKEKERREDDDRSYYSQPDTAASSKALDNEAARQPCGCSSSCGCPSTAGMQDGRWNPRNMHLQATKANTHRRDELQRG